MHECFEYPTTEHQRLEAAELLNYLDAVNLATLGWGWQVAVQAWHGQKAAAPISVKWGVSVKCIVAAACFHCLVCWLVGCALKSYRQAAKQFLKDLQGVVGVNGEREEGWRGGIRWGPLLSWAFLNGNSFQMSRGYLEPLMTQEEYKQVGDDAMTGIRMTLHQLGIRPRTRSLQHRMLTQTLIPKPLVIVIMRQRGFQEPCGPHEHDHAAVQQEPHGA